jgi:transposase
VTSGADILPDDIDALRAALLAERTARHEAEARATGAEAMIAHLKLLIAKLERDRFGPTSERSRRLLDQLELQLEELEASTAEAEAKRPEPAGDVAGRAARAKPVRGALPAHLLRERVVIPGPTECPCCQGKLSKLGETVTETLEVIPRQWKVIQTVREKFTCRTCETITSRRRRSTRLPAGVPGPSCWP